MSGTKPGTSTKPSSGTYNLLVFSFLAYAVGVGYFAGTRPTGAWRFFSWHPFLMLSGFVGCMGTAAVTKKLGGYTNTKNHGLIANAGLMMIFGGLYVIYTNKSNNGSEHFTSYHGKAGLSLVICSIGAGMAGGIFLHPDFGVDKTNKQIRFVHKTFARAVISCAWMVAVSGMYTLTTDVMSLAIVAVPLLVFAPFTLI